MISNGNGGAEVLMLGQYELHERTALIGAAHLMAQLGRAVSLCHEDQADCGVISGMAIAATDSRACRKPGLVMDKTLLSALPHKPG